MIWFHPNQGNSDNMHPIAYVNKKEDEESVKGIIDHLENGIDRLRSSVLVMEYTVEDRTFPCSLDVDLEIAAVRIFLAECIMIIDIA